MELDADYYVAACKRFKQHKAQGSLFVPDTPRDAYEQTDFLPVRKGAGHNAALTGGEAVRVEGTVRGENPGKD